MAAGIVPTASDINFRAATVALELWTKLDQARDWYLYMADANHTDAYFNAIGITGSKATPGTDLGKLFAAAADLGNSLWSVGHGKQTQAAVNDFFFTAYTLTGMNWAGSAQ